VKYQHRAAQKGLTFHPFYVIRVSSYSRLSPAPSQEDTQINAIFLFNLESFAARLVEVVYINLCCFNVQAKSG
jgi:hypothetical protein